MRANEMLSNWSGTNACRALRSGLKQGAYFVLALALCASAVNAQGDKARQPSDAAREAAGSAKTRSRRVSSSDAATKSNNATPTTDVEAVDETTTSEEKAAGQSGAEDESAANAAGEAAGGDRIGKLRAQMKDAKTEADRARLRRTLVDYLVALDRKQEAIDELRATMKGERFDPVGLYNTGNALARLGDTDGAVDAYRKAIEQRRGHYSRALNNLGVVLLRQGRWDEAQTALTSALKQEANRYPEASYNLGRLYSLRGEADLAIREWSRVLALQPDHVDAALALARAYAEDGNPQRAVSVIDSFTARRGANNELATARSEILYEAGADEWSAMEATAGASKSVAATKPAVSNVKANDGASASQAKSTERDARSSASPATLRSLTVDTETYELLEQARAAREAGKNQEAVAFYQRVLARRGGFFPPANLEMSFALASLERRAEAIASLQKFIAREGARYPIAYYHLGRQFEALGQLAASAEAYSRAAFAYGEREPQFLLDVSRVREREGNIAAALAAMEEYARISEQRGRTPEWTAERISELRQKQNAAATQKPAPKQ